MKNKTETVLSVNNLTKTFKLPEERHSSLKQTIINFRKSSYTELKVLDDISFEIKKGDFFGVVGRNGSGKSTLLKLIAGIYQPTSGSIKIKGNLTPFIELGVGFNMELTGTDNVYLNGAILGLSEKEIDEKYEEIVRFAELEKFMGQKLKNYSSGMLVRLAFSVAIQAHNEILLIDEVLAVGDANFQRKCFNVFKDIKKSGKTVVFVTHDMNAVQEFCNSALIIHDGKKILEGKPQDVAAQYNEINFASKTDRKSQNDDHYGTGEVRIKHVRILKKNKSVSLIQPDDEVTIEVTLSSKIETNYLLGISIRNQEGITAYSVNTENEPSASTMIKKFESRKIYASFTNILGNGTYHLSLALKNKDRTILFDQINDIKTVEVAGWKNGLPIAHIKTDIKIR